MIIVVEGPDNSGKSTLAQELSRKLGWQVLHSGGPCESKQDYMERIVKIYNSHRVIWDRHPAVSEYIYGPVLRGVYNYIPLNAFPRESLVIYCRPPDEVLLDFRTHRKNHRISDEHDQQVEARARDIIKVYDDVMFAIPHHKYDWTQR